MQCSDFEIRLCEYQDGTLEPAARREMELHISECPHCAALAADARAFGSFLERVPPVEAPPELVTSILYQTHGPVAARKRRGWRRWLGPLLQPRIVMGMAMTILSISMLSRVAGVKVRQLEAADLNPVSIWRTVDNQAHRMWDRGVKFYQNVRFIYEIMSQLRASDQEEEPPAAPGEPPAADRRIPDKRDGGR
jgi:anti-sigma factor RsiW